jgi:hypothetical protein
MAPKGGDRYRSLREVPVGVHLTYRNPSSGGFRGTLPSGEVVTVEFDPPPHAKAVSAVPVRYEALAQILVSPQELHNRAFDTYRLVITLDQIASDFEQVK